MTKTRPKNSPLSFLERKNIFKYIQQGLTLSKIGPLIERGKNSVVFEVRRNEGREIYDPKIAQAASQQRKNEADDKRWKIKIVIWNSAFMSMDQKTVI